MEKKILLGLHGKDCFRDACERACRNNGYSVTSVKTLEEMSEKARNVNYQRYVMDANLGKSHNGDGSLCADVTPCVKVYNIVEPRVKEGLAKFMAISGNLFAVNNATKKGIPASYTLDFDLIKFLQD